MDRTRNLGAALMSLVLALGAPLQACADGRDRATFGMTTAPNKVNGSGVTVQYRVDPLPQAGHATSILLSFGGIVDPAGATVQLRADAGLSIDSAATSRALPAGEVTTWTVEVVPATQGVGYLHVFTTQSGTTSSISIPVQVGKAPAAMPSIGELKPGPGDEKILSMPVK